MKGRTILISTEPKGRNYEGTISGTPKPGTVMQIDASAGLNSNGNFTFEVYNADADGGRPKGPIFVLLENKNLGGLASTAYANGDHGFLYVPLPGDELNMLLQDVGGTADDHALGEVLIIDDGTGKLIATTGTPETEPFFLMEAVTDPVADTLAHCLFTGY